MLVIALLHALARADEGTAEVQAPEQEAPSCAVPLTDALARAETAALASDVWGFRAAYGEALAGARCLNAVVSAEDVARLHSFTALSAQVRGAEDEATAAFVAARALGAPEPAWLGAGNTAIRVRWEAAARAEPQVWERLEIQEGTTLYVDGSQVWAHPTGQPALVQLRDAEGVIIHSDYYSPGQVLPASWAKPAPSRVGSVGSLELERAVELLNQGDYSASLRISVPAVSKYPDLSLSFLAVSNLAMAHQQPGGGGLRAENVGAFLTPDEAARLQAITDGAALNPMDRMTGEIQPMRLPPRPRGRMLMGIEMGLPLGFRAEWKLPPPDRSSLGALDSVGMRMGMGVMAPWNWYTNGALEMLGTLDWGAGMDVQVQTSMGLIYLLDWGGSLSVGSALQYDPPSPFQVSLGGHVDLNGFTPEANIAYLW